MSPSSTRLWKKAMSSSHLASTASMTAFTMCSATRMFRLRSQNAISGSIILHNKYQYN